MAGKKVKEQATDQAPEQEQEVIRELTEEKGAVLRNDPEFMDPLGDNWTYQKQTRDEKITMLAQKMFQEKITAVHFNLAISKKELTELWIQCKRIAEMALILINEIPEK